MHTQLGLLQLLPVIAYWSTGPSGDAGGAEPFTWGDLGKRGREAVEVPRGVAFVAFKRRVVFTTIFMTNDAEGWCLDFLRMTGHVRELVTRF